MESDLARNPLRDEHCVELDLIGAGTLVRENLVYADCILVLDPYLRDGGVLDSFRQNGHQGGTGAAFAERKVGRWSWNELQIDIGKGVLLTGTEHFVLVMQPAFNLRGRVKVADEKCEGEHIVCRVVEPAAAL